MNTDDMSQLRPAEAVPAGLETAPAVLWAAYQERLQIRSDAQTRCRYLDHVSCGQAIVKLSTQLGPYVLQLDEITACLLAHLEQRHGWTRETVGYA